MNLYTDGTTAATKVEAQAYVDELTAAELLDAGAQASVDDVQDYIDADAKLTAALVVPSLDAVDPSWLVLNFPADVPGQPLFWAGVVQQFGGEVLSAYQVRCSKSLAPTSLAKVSALLPDPV